MTATWLLNRHIIFAGGILQYAKSVEGAVYASIMLVGAGINFSIYSWLFVNSRLVRSYPTLGVAAGSGIALVWNFVQPELSFTTDQPDSSRSHQSRKCLVGAERTRRRLNIQKLSP